MALKLFVKEKSGASEVLALYISNVDDDEVEDTLSRMLVGSAFGFSDSSTETALASSAGVSVTEVFSSVAVVAAGVVAASVSVFVTSVVAAEVSAAAASVVSVAVVSAAVVVAVVSLATAVPVATVGTKAVPSFSNTQ